MNVANQALTLAYWIPWIVTAFVVGSYIDLVRRHRRAKKELVYRRSECTRLHRDAWAARRDRDEALGRKPQMARIDL